MQLIYSVLTGCCLVAALQDVNFEQEWWDFKQKFNKSSTNTLMESRSFMKFKNNLQIILEHNERYKNGEVSFEMGLNPYSDKDIKDMEATSMGLKIEAWDSLYLNDSNIFVKTLQNTPDSIDWRKIGAVTPVKNQGTCGSCWAFSATGALESRNFFKTNKLVELSEQNLLDCNIRNGGCNGGWMSTAFNYIHDNDGIDTEPSYPYQGIRKNCNYRKEYVGAKCTGYTTTAKGNENDLKSAVAILGPFSVAIKATRNFQNYKSGVLDDDTCKGEVNHAVLIVGYGSEKGMDYWLVKNSWGTSWGESGYVRMSRNKRNQCSIASYAIIPKV